MVMNLKPGYYYVFTMAPLKVKSLKSFVCTLASQNGGGHNRSYKNMDQETPPL